ncbi:MAG TPA: NAD(P)H-hydrate dehydratase [Caulobacteraceae bacterium]
MLSGLEILTVAQAAAADRAATEAGVESFALMRAAGEAVARAVRRRWTAGPVAVLCGPGLNGGDGYVAAAALAADGWPVRVFALAEPGAADAGRARALWNGPVEPFGADLGDPALVIDALFGAGLSRPLTDEVAGTLKAIEASGAALVAVDLPSGLAGDTGKPLGYAPQARLTVTFHRRKPAHVLEPGRGLCGEVVVAPIGIPDSATPRTDLFENHPALWRDLFPWPGAATHKHSRGLLGVVSGGPTSTGAARLAARAGLRAGAGLVRMFCPPDAAAVLAPALEAVMLQPVSGDVELAEAAAGFQTVVIGPAAGVSEATAANVLALARADGLALVVDADGLTVFGDAPQRLFEALGPDDVLTPHPGEFERLFPGLLAGSPERISAAREAARQAGAVVLLKGPDTVIAAPDGRAAVNLNGVPWLATAGSGDVLAGIIGGLRAQGMQGFEAACAGAWMHAEAARIFGPGLIAEDLPDRLTAVFKSLEVPSNTVL